MDRSPARPRAPRRRGHRSAAGSAPTQRCARRDYNDLERRHLPHRSPPTPLRRRLVSAAKGVAQDTNSATEDPSRKLRSVSRTTGRRRRDACQVGQVEHLWSDIVVFPCARHHVDEREPSPPPRGGGALLIVKMVALALLGCYDELWTHTSLEDLGGAGGRRGGQHARRWDACWRWCRAWDRPSLRSPTVS